MVLTSRVNVQLGKAGKKRGWSVEDADWSDGLFSEDFAGCVDSIPMNTNVFKGLSSA